MSTAAGRRQVVAFLTRRQISQRRACQLTGLSRRWLHYQGREDDPKLVKLLGELARRYPAYGYRMLHRMLQRELAACGDERPLNVKKVRRMCRDYGLKLPVKKRRKRHGQGVKTPCRAEYARHVWAYDFVFDATADGQKLKILTVEDEFTREALAVVAGRRMNAMLLAQTLLALFAQHGVPEYVRSDNGPEFIAEALMHKLTQAGVTCRHIEPGSPWQNGTNERFNGTLRRECLDLETFAHVAQARALCRLYQREYNQRRPHSSLGHQTPAEFAARHGPAAPAPSSAAPRPGLPPQTRAGANSSEMTG